MVVLSKGEYIWLKPAKPSEFAVSIGAKVVGIKDGKFEVEDDDGHRRQIASNEDVQIMHKSVVEGTDDMINLGDLNESGILRNLQIRYRDDKIYTYTGSILVAINPYKKLHVYENEYILMYKNKDMSELPPHIYAVADNAYRDMKNFDRNQTAIISGESGSGKTETTKFLLKFLAYSSGQHSWIEQQILDSNPILEAFGNAKTVRNDNSSRFGKYIDISFDKSGHIVKAKILQYLLEKSRIIGQDKGERNYHIFYCMLAGLSEKQKQEYFLDTKANYNYLQKDSYNVDTRNELNEWNAVRTAFKVMMFSEQNVMDMMKILVGFLHFGQIEFEGSSKGSNESVGIRNMQPVGYAAEILQLNPDGLKKALTHKTITVSNQTIVTTLNKDQANDVRDTFVKNVYGKMFEWLVAEINRTITKDTTKGDISFGILDIFGFENIGTNSFEQLCINYTNERLQQFFIHHVFKLEQHEYDLENINWQKVQFLDNQEIVEFIALKPMNLFALIDEETIFPKGTDETFVAKIFNTHSKSKYLTKPKGNNRLLFTLRHFAGDVTYNAKHFLEKNRDTFSADFKTLLLESNNAFIKGFYGNSLDEKVVKSKQKTLANQFKAAMEDLMLIMSQRHPSFVRCIKPNENKLPNEFDRDLITRQLRYSGMMETIRIRKAGYPIRHLLNDFVMRYHLLTKSNKPITPDMDFRATSTEICKNTLNESLYQIGKTKVFLKDAGNNELESARHRILSEKIVGIQGMIRNWASRRIFNRIREATGSVQSFWKNSTEQRNYAKMRRGFMRLQAIPISKLASRRYYMLLESTPLIQEACRDYLLRNFVLTNFSNILLLQQLVRKYIAVRTVSKTTMQVNDVNDARQMKNDTERKLIRVMGADKGKAEAEKRYDERMDEIQERFELLNAKDESEKIRKNEIINSLNESKHWLSLAEMEIDRAFRPIFDTDISSRRKKVVPITEEEEAELIDFKFSRYASENFQGHQTPRYQKEMLKKPLLKLPNRLFDMVALSCWILLRQFMDGPSSKKVKSRMKDVTIMEFALRNYAALIRVDDDDELELRASAYEQVSDDEKSYIHAGLLPKVTLTPFEIIQFHSAVGILFPELRDEIYCQLLKQLTSNESVESFGRGWVMLSFLVGMFPPSDEFVKYLKSFIRNGPKGYAEYSLYKLNRTLKNGTRTHTPSFMECVAMKTKKPLQLSITMMDDSAVNIYVDSTTIGKEAVMSIASKIKINDVVGFGIRASVFSVTDVVNENDHIMDIVSLCEDYATKLGVPVRSTPLRMALLRSYFPPWVLPMADSMAVKLIFEQFVRGLKYGEYKCEDVTEHMYYAAQIYYASVGSRLTIGDLEAFMPKVVLEDDLLAKKNRKHYTETFRATFAELKPQLKATFGDSLEGRELLKAAIVDNMRYRWPTKFSRYFYLVDITSSGLSVERGDLVVTWKSINYLQNRSILLVLRYPEIVDISDVRPHDAKKNLSSFTVSTPNQAYTFSLERASVLQGLLIDYITGLKERSCYALVVKDYIKGERGKGALALRRGDLVTIYSNEEEENSEANQDLYFGENDRNGKEGYFPKDCVYIIPANDKPSAAEMEALSTLAFKTVSEYMNEDALSTEVFPAWEKYAKKYFKSSRRAWSRRDDKQMVHQKEPLRRPLLSAIHVDESREMPLSTLAEEALKCFRGILRYERLPQKGYKMAVCQDIVDSIFKPCLKATEQDRYTYLLKEEVYCQIIKQLMRNGDPDMARRVWELLYLVTGLFLPKKELHLVLNEFLKSRNTKLADACVQRMKKLAERKQRRMPPTLVEIDSIQKNALRMFHQVKLPDESEEKVTVDSLSTTADIEKQLSQKLQVKSPEEFSIIVRMKTTSKSIPPDYYLFDYVRQMTDELLARTKDTEKRDIRFAYELLYLRKLWINIVPGEDIQTDVIFHYPQELHKYLRGFYDVSEEDAVDIALLIYIAKFGNNPARLNTMSKEIAAYIPKDMINQRDPEEWVNKVEEAFEETEEMSKDEAKVQVLRILYGYPQFATTFVEVKQSGNSSFPNQIIIGLNKNGVSVIDPTTKETLFFAKYSKNMEWRVSTGLFHLTLNSSTTILCETNSENKLDELLTGYKDRLSSDDDEDDDDKDDTSKNSEANKESIENAETAASSDMSASENESDSEVPQPPHYSEFKSVQASAGTDLERKLEELRKQLNATRKPVRSENIHSSVSDSTNKADGSSPANDKYSNLNEIDL